MNPSSQAEPGPPPSRWALAALLAGNVLPLLGVLFGDWQVSDLLLLYWLENGVIGLYTVLKLLLTRSVRGWDGVMVKLFMVPFFCLHYGIFWVAHGMFILNELPSGPRGALGRDFGPLGLGPVGFNPFDFRYGVLSLAQDVLASPLAPALLVLALSHGVSFVANYLLRGEVRRLDPGAIMFRPYARVFVLHVVIIVGSILVMLLGSPVFALLLLVLLKTVVDARAHLREHARA